MNPRISTLYDGYRGVCGILRVGFSVHQFYSLSSLHRQIFEIFLNTMMVLKEIFSEGLLLSELGYERRHRKDLMNYQQVLGRLFQPPPPIYYLDHWGYRDDTTQRDRAWMGIDDVVDSYRQINARFEKLQWIGLGFALLRGVQQEHLKEWQWAFLMLHELVKVIRFRAKAHCDASLFISRGVKLFLDIYDVFRMIQMSIKIYNFVQKNWFPENLPPCILEECLKKWWNSFYGASSLVFLFNRAFTRP